MREMWSLAVDRLRPLILATRGHAGGFGIMLAKPDSRLDVWTSAQCVSAIVMLDERPPSELKDTFRFFESERELDGWSRWREYAKPTTEVTAWVGLAWLHSVGAGRFWENDREREAAIVQIKRIYGQLTSRQSHEGGWASYRTAYAKPSAFGDYATAMALSFLGELKRSKAIPVEVSVLDDQIRRGLGWIVDRYDPEAKGWKEPLGAVVQRDLATLNIMLLTEAKIGGLAFLESLPQLQRARDDWLAAAAEDSGRRDIGTSTQMRQAQEVFDEHGTLKREDDFTVSLMWYPWTLLAASEVARDAAAPARVRTTAAAIEERLWSRMPEAVKTFSAGVTFPAAETLYALGLARRNGVLGRSTR
jgi:hypothetical protein